MKIGPYTLTSLETGRFKLDGGAMFGNVPKPLWEKAHPADDRNRIELALRCLLVQGDGRCVVIDTGIGDKWDEKLSDIFAIRNTPGLVGALGAAGVSKDDVTDVILTHLHFDHAGGATIKDADNTSPTFPNARYHVQARNLAWAQTPNPRERASYLPENFQPLVDAGVLTTHDGDVEILPGISAITSHGHTEGLQMIRVSGDGGSLVYCADLIPTSTHVHVPFIMGYDIRAIDSAGEKKTLLEPVAQDGTWLFFEHDPECAAAQVEWTGKKFAAINKRTEL